MNDSLVFLVRKKQPSRAISQSTFAVSPTKRADYSPGLVEKWIGSTATDALDAEENEPRDEFEETRDAPSSLPKDDNEPPSKFRLRIYL